MHRLFSGKVIFYLLVLFLLDVSVLPVFRIGSLQPVLLYLAVLYAAFEWEWMKAVRIAFAAGLMRDFSGSQPLGVETIVLVAASFALGYVLQKIERNSNLMRALISAVYVTIVTLLIFVLSAFLGFAHSFSWRILGVSLGTGVLTGALAPFVFAISRRWFQKQESSLKQYELFG